MLHQTFSPGDLATLAVLAVLEVLLSVDNALVLGILASQVAVHLRVRVLMAGLIGALIFRTLAIGAAVFLIRWRILRLIGGLYLLWVCLKYFLRSRQKTTTTPAERTHASFWGTVLAIELTDLAFAADSILAAVALVGPPPLHDSIHPKFWLILLGGMIGVIVMRFAAAGISALLIRFTHLHRSAYFLVMLIAVKLIADYAINSPEHPDRVDFDNTSRPEFWIFWALMAAGVAAGFVRRRTA